MSNKDDAIFGNKPYMEQGTVRDLIFKIDGQF